MTDNQRVAQLQRGLVDALNASTLPTAIKVLALDNLVLTLRAGMQSEEEIHGK